MSRQSQANQDEDNGGERKMEELALERAAVEALKDEEMDADEFNLLDDDDMLIFGLNPLTDILKLVSCNNCKKPVIDSQFSPHFERCVASRIWDPLHIAVGHEDVKSEPEEGQITCKIERRKRSQKRNNTRMLPKIAEEIAKRRGEKDLNTSAPPKNEQSPSFWEGLHGNDKAIVERKLCLIETEVSKQKGKDTTERDLSPSIKEVSETNDSKRRHDSEESIAQSKSKRISSQDDHPVGEEPYRPVFRIRRRDVADICSDIRSQLRRPLPVVTQGGQERAAVGPESHPHSSVPSKRRKHVRLQETEVGDVQNTTPPTKSTTSGDKKSKKGRQVAEIMTLLRKKGSTADDKRGGKLFRNQRKKDMRPNVGDARASRRAKREKMKDQLILERFNKYESSSKSTSSGKMKSLVKSTEVSSLRRGADHGLSKTSIHEHRRKTKSTGAANDEGDLRHNLSEKKKIDES